uniref:Mitochondrial fission process protein 1 n=1 Tax=Oncorhynchus mykiss TaxID=8022 RepID=A0A8C7SUL5_ONCMY
MICVEASHNSEAVKALLHSYLTLACNLVLTGYANEVGEAFRALAPVSAVWATRAVATVYVSADDLDKGKKALTPNVDVNLRQPPAPL